MARSDRPRRFVFASLVASLFAVPALLACNALIGLDEFDKVPDPCRGAACEDASVEDVFVPDAEADRVTPPGADPVSWADWPMPNSKLDAGTDAPNPIAYQVIDDTEVQDTVTGLIWRRRVVGDGFGTELTQEQARAECKKLGSWRLPKRIELVTLLSHGQGRPFIDRGTFVDFPSSTVWTSSEVRKAVLPSDPPSSAIVPNRYWTVDFRVGAVAQLDGNEPAKVLCVKAK